MNVNLRKIKLFAHLIRYNEFSNVILEGKAKELERRPRSFILQEAVSSYTAMQIARHQRKLWLQQQRQGL